MGRATTWQTINDAKRDRVHRRRPVVNSTLDRVVPTEGILVPAKVDLQSVDGEPTLTVAEGALEAGEIRQDVSGLVNTFGALADAGEDEEQYRHFAEQWGLLLLCEHGLPYTERSHRRGLRCRPTLQERVSNWWRYASSFRALISVAGQLRAGEKVSDADWSRAWWGHPWEPGENVTRETSPPNEQLNSFDLKDLEEEAPAEAELLSREKSDGERLARYVQSWLDLADLRPTVMWRDKKERLEFSYSPTGLFGHLALELALTVSRADGLRLCAAHEDPSIPAHYFAPSHGNQKFCSAHDDPNLKDRLRKRRARSSDQ